MGGTDANHLAPTHTFTCAVRGFVFPPDPSRPVLRKLPVCFGQNSEKKIPLDAYSTRTRGRTVGPEANRSPIKFSTLSERPSSMLADSEGGDCLSGPPLPKG